jgi:hypothetical protein
MKDLEKFDNLKADIATLVEPVFQIKVENKRITPLQEA